MFSTAELIGDTVNKETNIINQQKLVKNPNWQEAGQLAIKKSTQELNLGPPKTNPSSGREENLNPGPLAYKSSALATRKKIVIIIIILLLLLGHARLRYGIIGL